MCWGAKQRIDIQLSKLRFEASVNVFISRLVLAERKGDFVYNIMYGKFWFDGEFFVQNLDASMELRQYQSLSQGKSSFFSWQIGTLSFLTDWYSFFLLWALFFFSFFFFFFTNDFLPLLTFHKQRFFIKQKAFTSEFCKVFDVSKIWQ